MLGKLFPATVVGSMPRPQFFREIVDRALAGEGSDEELQPLMDRAIPYVVALQEAAGIDIISDGEWRRKSYVGVIAESYSGFEQEKRWVRTHRHSAYVGYTVTGEVRPTAPGFFAREARFLKAQTDRPIRIALPTPFLIGSRTWDGERSADAYPTVREFTDAMVPVLRDELIALRDEGVRFVQFDDPDMGPDPDEVEYAVDALNRVVEGVEGLHLSMHLCGRRPSGTDGRTGYHSLIPGLLDLKFDQLMVELLDPDEDDLSFLAEFPETLEIGTGCVAAREPELETPEEIVSRVRRILGTVSPERVALHPDCGFSTGTYYEIPLDETYAKMRNEVLAAEMLRKEFG